MSLPRPKEVYVTDNKRLVYSTEHGTLDQPMRDKRKKSKHQTRAIAITRSSKHGVRIRREVKGRGGKTVSVVDGLPLPDEELKALLKRIKGQLGTGGTMRNGSLEIQGDHRKTLLYMLVQEGYTTKLAGG